MKTLIFRGLLVVSLLLGVAACVMWWRSWRVCEGARWVSNDGSWREVVSYAGGVIVSEMRPGLPVFPSSPNTERRRVHEPVAQGVQPSWRCRVPSGALAEVAWEAGGVVAASGQVQSAVAPTLTPAVYGSGTVTMGSLPTIWNAPLTASQGGGSTVLVAGSLGGAVQGSSGPTVIELDEGSAEAVRVLGGTSLAPLINQGKLQAKRINGMPVTLTAGSMVINSPVMSVLYQVVKVPYWLIVALCGLVPGYALLGLPGAVRRRRRRVRGLCVQCGYDLRASDGRCPECGTAKAV